MTVRVTVWGENVQEHIYPLVAAAYPSGIHTYIADALNADERLVSVTATLQQAEHGLTERVLGATDVLVWWSHMADDEVGDKVVDRVCRRVLEGMGLVVLHSAWFSKAFLRLVGPAGAFPWREAGEREHIWPCIPDHPIAEGVTFPIVLDHEEMYGEPSGVPPPDEVVLVSWFQGGEVFRSGMTFRRGAGRIFYFRPGHEEYPTYHEPEIQRVLRNACAWAGAPSTE
jgi:trehalose utilization protein